MNLRKTLLSVLALLALLIAVPEPALAKKADKKPRNEVYSAKVSKKHKKKTRKPCKLINKINCTTTQDLIVDQQTLALANQINQTTKQDLTVDREILDKVSQILDCTCEEDLDLERTMKLGTGDIAVGVAKLFNVPSRSETYQFYKSGAVNFVDEPENSPARRFQTFCQHQIQSNRSLFKWEVPRENVRILDSVPVSTLSTDSAFSGTSDNWAFSMSAAQKGAFIFEVTNQDLLMFDAPGEFTAPGSIGFGAGRLGDIMDIRDPVSGYKLRLWAANPSFSINLANYNPQDYNPGPDYFGGVSGEIADFVIGVDNYAGLTFEDILLRFFISPDLLSDYAYILCYQDGTFDEFPDNHDIEHAIEEGLLYYYDLPVLPFEMTAVGDTFFGPATFTLSLTGDNALSFVPEVTHMGVLWNNPGQLPPGGYQDAVKNNTYDPLTDFNPFRTGDATLAPYGAKRLLFAENGPAIYPEGTPNNTFTSYVFQDPSTKVRSYTIGTTLNGIHVYTHDMVNKPLYAKLLNSFPTPSVFEDTIPTGISSWHDVKTYQSQQLALDSNEYSFTPLQNYVVEAIYEVGGEPQKVTAAQFLSNETEENEGESEGRGEYRFKCPFLLDPNVLAPLPLELRIRLDD